jgi:hypothetical protein
MSALARFLERNSAKVGKPLPIVHSTRAYYLEKILSSQKIVYLEHKAIRQYLAPYGAKLYGYSVYSLNAAAYFSQIYNYIKHFYEKRKLLNV